VGSEFLLRRGGDESGDVFHDRHPLGLGSALPGFACRVLADFLLVGGPDDFKTFRHLFFSRRNLPSSFFSLQSSFFRQLRYITRYFSVTIGVTGAVLSLPVSVAVHLCELLSHPAACDGEEPVFARSNICNIVFNKVIYCRPHLLDIATADAGQLAHGPGYRSFIVCVPYRTTQVDPDAAGGGFAHRQSRGLEPLARVHLECW
jgi:hypothetical protein